MLSKFKKLFRSSRSLSPLKEKEDKLTKDKEGTNKDTLVSSNSKGEKGKRKTSQTQQQQHNIEDEIGPQNECSQEEDIDIVENEFSRREDEEYPFFSMFVNSLFVFFYYLLNYHIRYPILQILRMTFVISYHPLSFIPPVLSRNCSLLLLVLYV